MLVNLTAFKNLNNYFNKIFYKKDTLSEYTTLFTDFVTIEDTNFNPNDDVNTTHIVGSKSQPFSDPSWDYVIITNPTDNSIISRWFVTEAVRTMANQYNLTLKRDLVADFYEQVISAPCYIEKGYLDNVDPMVVNNEGISFNEIKSREYYLKDITKCPWVVVYIKQDRTADSPTITANFAVDDPSVYPDLSTSPLYSVLVQSGTLRTNVTLKNHIYKDWNFDAAMRIQYQGAYWTQHWVTFVGNKNKDIVFTDGSYAPDPYCYWGAALLQINENDVKLYFSKTIKDVSDNTVYNILDEIIPHTGDNFNDRNRTMPTDIDGKIYQYNGKAYKLHFRKINSEIGTYTDSRINPCYEASAKRHFAGEPPAGAWTWYIRNMRIRNEIEQYSVVLEELQSSSCQVVIKKDNFHCVDIPYDIIAMPIGNKDVKISGTTEFTTVYNVAINMARSIVKQEGSFAIDAQILPYCPNAKMSIIDSDGNIELSGLTEHTDYEYIVETSSGNAKRGILFYARSAFNTIEIDKLGSDIINSDEENVSDVLSVSDRKLESNCNMYRLSSPNYGSSFEFNLAKCVAQTGSYPNMSKFKVDIAYRPFNPYIHIAPDFAFLYGGDYNDARGLICQGDFGITTLSDHWVEYQNNNKNFQNSFNRQISHMETERGLQREAEAWGIGSAFAGLGGIAGGIGLANKFMKKPQMAIGGGVISAIGTGVDIVSKFAAADRAERSYQENRQYAIDMFNMQMDNIKAMPDTITHTCALTNNFKFFPILEFYTCTDVEKDALRDKMKYNGMTIGRIDIISNYLSSSEVRFVKGQLIRLFDLGEDSHVAMELYNIINSGYFFAPYTIPNT